MYCRFFGKLEWEFYSPKFQVKLGGYLRGREDFGCGRVKCEKKSSSEISLTLSCPNEMQPD